MNSIIRQHTAVANAIPTGAVTTISLLGSPAYDARRTLERCRVARLPKFFRVASSNLSAARKLIGAGLPRANDVIDAIVAMDAADDVQIDAQTSRLISAVLLDAFGRNARDNAETLIDALSLVAGDDDYDEDVIGVASIRPSALVAALATLRIIKTHKFMPTASEFRAAMYEVRIKLSDLREHLQKARIVIDAVEETIGDYGRPHERLLSQPLYLEWEGE